MGDLNNSTSDLLIHLIKYHRVIDVYKVASDTNRGVIVGCVGLITMHSSPSTTVRCLGCRLRPLSVLPPSPRLGLLIHNTTHLNTWHRNHLYHMHNAAQMLTGVILLPCCMECRRGLAMRILSVRLSVKCVICDFRSLIELLIFGTACLICCWCLHCWFI